MTRPKGNDHKSVAKYAASYPACHPERNEMESKDLRTFDTAKQTFGAKILRLALLAQDDKLVSFSF